MGKVKPHKNTFWNKFDLQNAAIAKLHRDNIEIDAEGNVVGGDTTDHEDDGDQRMDESGGQKRTATGADLTSNIDNKRTGPTTMTSTNERLPPPAAPPGGSGNTLALRASAAQTGGAGTGETPVDLGMPRELGIFTETRTAILPITFGVSFNKISRTPTTNVLKIRVNAPYDILGETTFINQTEGAAPAKGISANQAEAWASLGSPAFASFETTIALPTAATASTAGAGIPTDSNVRPAYRLWYERAYETYHVLECQYRLTFISPETTPGLRANVFIDKDVYTTSSTGNVMPVDKERFYYNSLYKHVDKIVVSERNNNDDKGWLKQYEGTWKPGQWSRNTLNDTDIKAWYSTGAAPSPAWVENLVVLVTSDEYNPNFFNHLNCVVELRYIVQFKDLVGTLRYPAAGTNITSTAFPSDVLQVPNTPAVWGSEV